MKKISILGSTGSIGLNTLKIINKKRNYFKINLLSANKNYIEICSQIKRYKPNFFLISNINTYLKVKKKLKNKTKTKIINKLEDLNIKKSDITVAAIPGIAGLKPTLLKITLSKKILIANKESIVCGWGLLKKKATKYKTKIIPVDSEHYSIFKMIENHERSEINKIYLTASGGPFLHYKKDQFKKIKSSEALKHPKWQMGKKISIDSATLINKLFELVEAQKLFDIPAEKLDIIIHPESLIHAIVELKNGLKKFIYHDTSMLIPLANAIFDGKLNIKDFLKSEKQNIVNLNFTKVDRNIFPIIDIKREFFRYPASSIIINACNEILVDQFLKNKIGFLTISKVIKKVLKHRNYQKYAIKSPKTINQILEIDEWAKSATLSVLNS